jgi:hypothetical protein
LLGYGNPNRRKLLGNDHVNTFTRQPDHMTAAKDRHATIEERLETYKDYDRKGSAAKKS